MRYFGLPIWYGSGRIDDVLQIAYEKGFDYVEISLDYPWPEIIDEIVFNRVKKLIKEYDFKVGIHAPWRDISLASPRENLRVASLKVYKKCISFAEKLESEYFNFHIFTKEATEYEEVYKAVYQATKRSIKEIVRLCNEAGVKPTLENNPTEFLGKIEEINTILHEIGNLYMCLDIGHMIVANTKKEELKETSELEKWFRTLGDKVKVIHIHDYRVEGEKVRDHFLLGKGDIDIDNMVNLINNSKAHFILLEMFWLSRNKRVSIDDLRSILIFLRSKIS